MTIATRTAIEAIVNADATATDEERARIRAAIEGGADIPRLVKRRELAKLAGCTPEMIDNYARRGYIKRVCLGDSSRSSGFDAESVKAFLAGRRTA